jgi:two-component system, NtrC family, response regulator HydG
MHTEAKLQKRIAYEKMLAAISERAVSINNIDEFLDLSIKSMGNILDVSRVFIFEYQIADDVFSCNCEWVADGISKLEECGGLTFNERWLAKELKDSKILSFRSTKDIPGEHFRKSLLAADVKSTLMVPLFIKEELYGFMGFDECRYDRKWIDEDRHILTTAAQIITKGIENKKYERELEQHQRRLESIFGSVQDGIITVDNEMRITEANHAAENICGFKMIDGQPFTVCMKDCNRSCQKVLQETLQTSNTIHECRVECGHRVRSTLVVMVTSSPLMNIRGVSPGAVLVIRDITRMSHLEKELKERHHFKNIVGKSDEMQKIYELLKILANLETTVLITGESGTGKDMIAKALHYTGGRSDKRFVALNCSALSENLLESELFGHVKGAFTGAERDRMGRFEAAQGGTIFLDEIGDISPLIQLKLLKVLQDREFERVGESIPKKADVRIIASTHRDLEAKIRKGEFRQDLYFRLKVMEIKVPPLRKRYEDILLLVNHFCSGFKKTYQKEISGISSDVLKSFMNYPWPGNIRELEHAIERAFVLCREQIIQLDHIPIEIKDYAKAKYPENENADATKDILKALERTDWNISKAARLLDISRWTIYRKLQKYDVGRPTKM